MTTLTILYLIFAKDTSIKENKFITPTIMKKVLLIGALKNNVRIIFLKVCGKTFRTGGEKIIFLPSKLSPPSLYLTNYTKISTSKKPVESHKAMHDIKFK